MSLSASSFVDLLLYRRASCELQSKEALASHEPNTGIQARVVSFAICEDVHCRHLKPHLLISKTTCTLERGHAKAISYAWGASGRKPRCIGHYENGTDVNIILGKEWHVGDLVRKLAALSTAKGTKYYWIDQLCMRQSAEEILAEVPNVFRTLDVVILLPGGICKCWLERHDSLSHSSELSRSSESEYDSDTCGHNHLFLHWFDRVWTQQELSYASCFRAVWISEPVTCETERNDLSWSKELQLGKSEGLLLRLSRLGKSSNVNSSALNGLSFWLSSKNMKKDTDTALVEFVNGHIFQAPKPLEQRNGDIDSFFRTITELSRNSRYTTKLRDYVLAVWVELPGYKVPSDFEDLSVQDLIQNAMLQIISVQMGCFVTRYPCVTLPAGLFGVGSFTFMWSPMHYLGYGNLDGSGQIYGAFCDSSSLGIMQDLSALLCHAWNPSGDEPVPAFQGIEALSRLTTEEIIEFFAEMLRSMTWILESRLSVWTTFEELGPSSYWIYLANTDNQRAAKESLQEMFSEQSNEEICDLVYDFTCMALGINIRTARLLDLQLMARLHTKNSQAPVVGLLRSDFDISKRARETTTMKPWNGISDSAVSYEVVNVIDEEHPYGKPAYRIVGVWAPTWPGTEDDIPKDFDAYIV